MKKMAYNLCLAALSVFPSLSGLASTPKATHVLTIASCPLWRKSKDQKPDKMCINDTAIVTSALQKTMDIESMEQLVDEGATYAAIEKAFEKLANVSEDDRVIIYMNAHASTFWADYKGYKSKDGVFALYSIKRPENAYIATKKKIWMPFRVFRDLLHKIPAKEVVLMVEACHAGDLIRPVMYDQSRHWQTWQGRQAIMVGTSKGIYASLTSDLSKGLFTDTFTKQLQSGKVKNWRDAFDRSQSLTSKEITHRCNTEKRLLDQKKYNWNGYIETCMQMPQIFDPTDLLRSIPVGKR